MITIDERIPVELPEPKSEYLDRDVAPLQIRGPEIVLVLPDTHIPFHEKTPLVCAVEEGKQRRASVVLLNGDVCDNYSISRFLKDPRLRRFKEEVEATRQYLAWLRDQFPGARIIWKKGNHCERWEAMLEDKLPDIVGLDIATFENLYKTSDHGVEVVGDDRVVRLGALNAIHGHEYKWAISNPVNPARGLFLRAKVHALTSHHHQTSQHVEKDLEQKALVTFSTGCLCGLRPRYRPYNNFNHGAAIVELDAEDAFYVDNGRIIHGTWY